MTDSAEKQAFDPGLWLCNRVLGEVADRIETTVRAIADSETRLLDVGCWDGQSTMRYAAAVGTSDVRGIEVYDGPAEQARARGVEVAQIDLESGRFPWPDGSADLVICNQVLEHLKNIWLPMTEIHRVLRVGGRAILSVPNLASLHNRILLALGRQPTSIRVFGPHVRSYTRGEFRLLVSHEGAFEVESCRGVGFYPVPSPLSAPLSALWAGGSHTIVLTARKASDKPVWSRYLESAIEGGMQTYYD